jgi:hypothetical protein
MLIGKPTDPSRFLKPRESIGTVVEDNTRNTGTQPDERRRWTRITGRDRHRHGIHTAACRYSGEYQPPLCPVDRSEGRSDRRDRSRRSRSTGERHTRTGLPTGPWTSVCCRRTTVFRPVGPDANTWFHSHETAEREQSGGARLFRSGPEPQFRPPPDPGPGECGTGYHLLERMFQHAMFITGIRGFPLRIREYHCIVPAPDLVGNRPQQSPSLSVREVDVRVSLGVVLRLAA